MVHFFTFSACVSISFQAYSDVAEEQKNEVTKSINGGEMRTNRGD